MKWYLHQGAERSQEVGTEAAGRTVHGEGEEGEEVVVMVAAAEGRVEEGAQGQTGHGLEEERGRHVAKGGEERRA